MEVRGEENGSASFGREMSLEGDVKQDERYE